MAENISIKIKIKDYLSKWLKKIKKKDIIFITRNDIKEWDMNEKPVKILIGEEKYE